IEETLREVQRCTRDGITINTFMLERSRALAEFVALITRMNRGRAFYATPEHLGEYVLVDFVAGRTRGAGRAESGVAPCFAGLCCATSARPLSPRRSEVVDDDLDRDLPVPARDGGDHRLRADVC